MRLLWIVLLLFSGLASAQPRVTSTPSRTQVVFSLPSSAKYSLSRSGSSLKVRFSGTPSRSGRQVLNTPHLVGWRATPIAGGTLYTLSLKAGVGHQSQALGNPRRLVINLARGAAVRPRTQPARPVVVLDAGHGGLDPGAVGFAPEKAITLDIVLRTQRLLEAAGIAVVLTRATDRHLSPNKKTDLRLRAESANSRRTVFVSVHANSSVGSAQGIEVYYFGDTIDDRLLSKAILENGGGSVGQQLTSEARRSARQQVKDIIAQANLSFSKELASQTLQAMVRSTGARSRGVRTAPFFVIRTARIPAVLVEVGFVNHTTEGRSLASSAYRQKLASGLASGIIGFIR